MVFFCSWGSVVFSLSRCLHLDLEIPEVTSQLLKDWTFHPLSSTLLPAPGPGVPLLRGTSLEETGSRSSSTGGSCFGRWSVLVFWCLLRF